MGGWGTGGTAVPRAMSGGAIDAIADRILAGGSGDAALAALRQTYHTLSSLSSAASRVRTAILDRGVRCREYDDSELRGLADPRVDAFLALPPKEQYAIQRAHASHPTWSDDAEGALARLRILPSACDALRLGRRDVVALKRKREAAILRKNEAMIVVPDALALLRAATAALERASPDDSFGHLIVRLLLVSGRRLTEITNGRSTFTPVPHTHRALFHGQLKKRGRAEAYEIPLLVPFAVFDHGLCALRAKQGAQIREKTNEQIKNLYQSNVQRLLSSGALTGAPAGIHTHDLRTTYVAFVWLAFTSPWSFSRTCCRILGHDSMQESLSYQNVRLDGAGALQGSLGPLMECAASGASGASAASAASGASSASGTP